jgi:hypothetical protein
MVRNPFTRLTIIEQKQLSIKNCSRIATLVREQ